MCNFVEGESIFPGWVCCACRCYNGLQRSNCKRCDHVQCAPETRQHIDTEETTRQSNSRESLEAIVADLTALLKIGTHLLPKIEAEVKATSFVYLVQRLNEIDMPEEAASQFADIKGRLPKILGFDITSLTEAMLPLAKAHLGIEEDLPN